MVNKNYLKGRRKEYKICKELKERGYEIVQRTAGSHSPIDVIAIDPKRKTILLVQAKPDNLSQAKTFKLLQENWGLNGKFKVSFEVK